MWIKICYKGLSQSIVGSIKNVYEATEFCIKWKRDEVMELIPQETGVREGCSLSPYLFNILIVDTDHIKKRKCIHH